MTAASAMSELAERLPGPLRSVGEDLAERLDRLAGWESTVIMAVEDLCAGRS